MAGLGTKMARRYDPAARRSYRARFRSYGGKAERMLGGGWGWLAGGLLALLAGVYSGYQDTVAMVGSTGAWTAWLKQITGGSYQGTNVRASIANLWSKGGYYKSPLSYLCYRFTGYNPDNKQWAPSAWVIPFWASLVGLITSMLPLGAKAKRIQRPLKAISSGALIVSTIGALALPATDIRQVLTSPVRQTSANTNVGNASPATNEADRQAIAYLASGNQATGGARRYLVAI